MDPTLTILIPAYNEEEALTTILADILVYCEAHKFKLILVDDGSVDRTPTIMDDSQHHDFVTVIHHKLNCGYGAALKTGIAHADTELIATLDADGQHQIEDIEPLLAALQKHSADMVVGRRDQCLSGFYRRVGKWFIRRLTGFLMPMSVQDINSGMKLCRTDLAKKYLNLCPDTMAFSNIITLMFIYQRHLVIEHPIHVQQRIGGKSTITTATAVGTIIEILNIIMLFNPLKIFLPTSLVLIVAGTGWGLPFVLRGEGLDGAAPMAIILGVICFFFGLVAEQIAQFRRSRLG